MPSEISDGSFWFFHSSRWFEPSAALNSKMHGGSRSCRVGILPCGVWGILPGCVGGVVVLCSPVAFEGEIQNLGLIFGL